MRSRIESNSQTELTVSNFQRVFESSPGNRLVVMPDDPLFTVAAANDRFLRKFRIAREQLAGQPLLQVLSENIRPLDSAALATSLRKVIASRNSDRVILRQSTPLQDQFWTVLNTPVIGPSGRLESILLLLTDNAKHIRREGVKSRGLEQATHQDIEMLESLTDGFAGFDAQWRFIYVNAAAERFLGSTRDQILGKNHWDLFPGTVGTVVETEYRRAMSDRISVEFEFFFEPWQRWFSIKCFPTKQGGLSNYFRDITDRKRAEHDLQRRHDDLANTNQRLEEFCFMLSHDLQEPLRAVRLSSEILLNQLQSSSSKLPEAAPYAELVRQGVARMQDRIEGLLTYAQAVQTEEPATGTADLAEAFGQALQVMSDPIRECAAQVTVAALPVVRGDLLQIAHVFQNLLSNSIKYRNPDSRLELSISAQLNATHWTISFQDNGIGFASSQAERIFGLFKRLHKQDAYPGTGIGLAICQRIVERHGGRMWADGRPGKGATFYIMLPKLDA